MSEWPSRHRQRSVCCFHVCSLFAFCRSSLLEVITYAPPTTTPLHWRPRCDDLLRLFGRSKSPERSTSADSNEKRVGTRLTLKKPRVQKGRGTDRELTFRVFLISLFDSGIELDLDVLDRRR